MKKSNGKCIRIVCLSLVVALAASFVLAEMPGLNDGPPDMDRKMNLGESGGVGSSERAEHYIVALDETAAGDPVVQAAVIHEVEAFGGTVYRRFSTVLNGGFAATLPTRALEALQSNPHVAFLEPDEVVGVPSPQTTAVNDDATTSGESGSADADCFTPMSWGIDRIDQRDLPLDNEACFDSNGSCASVYVVSTGIADRDPRFGGKAKQEVTFAGGPNYDCNGHGTYLAGTIHEIAPGAQVYGVKVLNCMGIGSLSDVVAGVEWVNNNAQSPGIMTVALGGGVNSTLDAMINQVADAGVVPVIAAGSSNQDACYSSPARATGALTVGATGIDDSRCSWSNWGSCVDIFAPGNDIESYWYTSPIATRTLSGTSVAAAHAAGVLALYCGNVSNLLHNATPNVITNPGTGSPNLLLFGY